MSRQAIARASFALLGSAVLASAALAQSFPSKMLNVVVPCPAGGASDFVARLMQPEYQKQLGQQMLVENIGGMAGALGVQKVLSAAADGHTQVLATPMELVLAPLALSAVQFKPEDLRFAGLLANTSVLLLVPRNSPAKPLDEVAALSNGKELTPGNVGVGSMCHLMAEKFAQQAGVELVQVPYKGGEPLMADIAGDAIDAAFFPMAGPVPGMVREGKVRALGIAGAKPPPLFQAAPSVSAHTTFRGFDDDIWIGVPVPKATPDAVINRVNTATNALLQNADVRKGLEGSGSPVAMPLKRAEPDRLYASQIERYRNMAKGINLTPQ